MISFEEAKQIADETVEPYREVFRKQTPNDDLVLESFLEFDDCWLFNFASEKWLQTKDIQYRLIGGGPIIVGKENRDVYQGGSSGTEEYWINKFREYTQNKKNG